MLVQVILAKFYDFLPKPVFLHGIFGLRLEILTILKAYGRIRRQ